MAATGHRMTASNLVVNGITYNGLVDLENIFNPRGSATPAANTGIRGAGVDLSSLFYPASAGGTKLSVNTGFRSAGVDLREIFAANGTVSGTPPGGGGCLPFGTVVPLWLGGSKPIEELIPGDVVIGYYVDGMEDEDIATWRDWSVGRDAGLSGVFVPVTIRMTLHGWYPNYWLINGALAATFEHRFFALRENEWMWRQAQDLQSGDGFMSLEKDIIAIHKVEFIDSELQIANIDVEPVDCFIIEALDGNSVLSHNPGEKG